MTALLAIEKLQVRFATPDGEVHAVKGVDLEVDRGETVAIVGESGSGKSQLMMAVMGLIAANGRTGGSARFDGHELIGLSVAEINRYRGRRLTMIFQEPLTSLDPLQTIETQIGDPLVYHRGLSRRAARPRIVELLELVGLPNPRARLGAYPHQLSGGQRQRAMIAMALAGEPDILIADEPTTALDVTIQAQILDLLKDLQKRLGMAIVFITHDLGIVRHMAERVYVMQGGEVREQGPVWEIFSSPRHPYTKKLLDAEPAGTKSPPPPSAPMLLDARNLTVRFRVGGGFLKRADELRAVDDVSLTLREGQTLGVVGESGSGKSTLGRALLGLLPADGRVAYLGREISGLDRRALQPLRRELQVVFQDPYGSLSPRLTVGEIVGEGLRVHEPGMGARERERRVAEALAEVQLDPKHLRRFPHEFSGGQRQRIAIARALVLRPRFVLLDEPTSALDRTIQKQIVELLRNLQAEHRLTYLFISHDLAVVRAMADTVLVMRHGRIVEAAPADELFAAPKEPYTRALLAAAFDLEPRDAAAS